MKSILTGVLLTFAIVLNLSIKAQTTPEAFLSRLPAIPNVACDADSSVVNRFARQIYEVKSDLQQNVDRIHAEEQANAENIKEKALSKVAQQSGLSEDELDQLQQNNGSEKQARTAANKVLGKQYNLSLQNLENLGEMSESEQEKWAQNYASQQMGKASQNPQATTNKQENSARLFELAKEQKAIGERIADKMTRAAQLLKSVEQQDSIENRKLDEKTLPLEKQLCSGICTPAEVARSRAAEKQIYNLRLQYCKKMSPLQINAISQYLTTVKTLFPDYRRLTEVQNELATLQTGVLVPTDLSCYAAVEEYANILSVAYNYCVGKFEQ